MPYVVDIAAMLDVSKQRAHQLRQRPDFPVPVERWTRGDLWRAADVKRWARSYYGPKGRSRPRHL